MRLALKATQFDLFGKPQEVLEPGKRGGRFYRTRTGHIRYGVRPALTAGRLVDEPDFPGTLTEWIEDLKVWRGMMGTDVDPATYINQSRRVYELPKRMIAAAKPHEVAEAIRLLELPDYLPEPVRTMTQIKRVLRWLREHVSREGRIAERARVQASERPVFGPLEDAAAIERKTPHTRLTWAGLQEWCDAYTVLRDRAERHISSKTYRDLQSHLAALDQATIDREQDLPTLRRAQEILRFHQPTPSSGRAHHATTPRIQWVHNQIARMGERPKAVSKARLRRGDVGEDLGPPTLTPELREMAAIWERAHAEKRPADTQPAYWDNLVGQTIVRNVGRYMVDRGMIAGESLSGSLAPREFAPTLTDYLNKHGFRNLKNVAEHVRGLGLPSTDVPVPEEARRIGATVDLSTPQAEPVAGEGRTWLREKAARDVAFWVNQIDRLNADHSTPEERVSKLHKKWTVRTLGSDHNFPTLFDTRREAVEMATRNAATSREMRPSQLEDALEVYRQSIALDEPPAPRHVPPGEPQVMRNGYFATHSDHSVRDLRQEATISNGRVYIISYVGRKKAGGFSFDLHDYPMSEVTQSALFYERRKFLHAKQPGMRDEPGGDAQAERIVDSQIKAIQACLPSDYQGHTWVKE